MGIIKKDAVRITILSYIGMFLGYLNKAFLFLVFLTTDEIGLLNLLLSVGLLFAQFCNLGTTYSIGKFHPFFRNRSRNNYGFMHYNFIVVTVGVLLFSLLIILFRPEISAYYIEKSPDFVNYYYWFLPIGIGYIYFLIFENYLKMLYDNFFAVLINEVVLRILTTMALVAYGLSWISFDFLVKSSSILYFIPAIMVIGYVVYLKEFNLLSWKITIPKRFKRIIFKFNTLSYFNTLGAIFVTTIDALMVASMIGLRETGIYTTIVFITSFLQVPYKTILRIANPIVATYWKENKLHDMSVLYQKTSSILLIISTALFMYVWINREAVFYILRPEFVSGIYVFLFLMIGRLTDMYFGLNGSIFVLSKKFAYDLIFTLCLIVLVVIMNLMFIPKWGMNGAAIGTMVSIVLYNIGRVLFIWKVYRLHPFTKAQIFVFILLIVNIILFEILPHFSDNRWIDIFTRCTLFTITYPLVIYLLKIEKEINQYVLNFYSKRFKRPKK